MTTTPKTTDDKKAHVRGVSFLDRFKTFKPATKQELSGDALLLKAFDLLEPERLLAITENLTITDGADAGKIEQTQSSIALALTDKQGEWVGAVFYQPNSKQPPNVIDNTGYGAIIIGENDPNSEVIAFDDLDYALEYYSFMIALRIEQTIIVSPLKRNRHQFKAIIQHWGSTRRVIVPMTLDDNRTKNLLSGVSAQAWITIADIVTMIDAGSSFDDVKTEAEIINLADTAYYPEWRKDKAVMLNEPMIYDDGRFELYHDGLYLAKYNLDDPANITFKYKMRICSALEVIAQTRDDTSNSWGRLLKWHDADNKLHQWAMPLALLQGDAREYRRELANQGLLITTNQKHRGYLDAYIQDYPAYQRALCVSKLGWYGERFVLPDRTLGGDDNELIVYQSSHAINSTLAQKGSLEQWRDNLCRQLADQSRFVFSIACAFAGQLLEPLGIGDSSGGFHLVGESSMGKSLMLKVAASVWGSPDRYVKTWRSTDNALEGTASQHNDSFLPLDEISESNAAILHNIIYMLGNGTGKGRSTTSGHNRAAKSWRIIFLSTGEKTVEQETAQIGKKTNAGVEIRLANIEADAGKGLKTFDSLVLAATSEAQADAITALSSSYFGSAGMAWLEHITKDKAAMTATAKTLFDEFMSRYPDIKGQAHRLGKRFAIVAAAGEMATQAGITGWQSGQATKAVATCFNNWLDNYGRQGEHEQRQIIEHIKAFIEQHGSSRFQPYHSPIFSEYEPKTINRAGYHNYDTGEYYFLTSVFDREVCSTFSSKKVLQVLIEANLLNSNEPDRGTLKVSIPHSKRRVRVYAVKADILNYDPTKMTGTVGTTGTNDLKPLYSMG